MTEKKNEGLENEVKETPVQAEKEVVESTTEKQRLLPKLKKK